jgi:hypothetical protein
MHHRGHPECREPLELACGTVKALSQGVVALRLQAECSKEAAPPCLISSYAEAEHDAAEPEKRLRS